MVDGHDPTRPGRGSEIGGQQIEEVVDRALLDDQPPIHVGLAERKRGIERKSPLRRPVGDAYDHGTAGVIAEP